MIQYIVFRTIKNIFIPISATDMYIGNRFQIHTPAADFFNVLAQSSSGNFLFTTCSMALDTTVGWLPPGLATGAFRTTGVGLGGMALETVAVGWLPPGLATGALRGVDM